MVACTPRTLPASGGSREAGALLHADLPDHESQQGDNQQRTVRRARSQLRRRGSDPCGRERTCALFTFCIVLEAMPFRFPCSLPWLAVGRGLARAGAGGIQAPASEPYRSTCGQAAIPGVVSGLRCGEHGGPDTPSNELSIIDWPRPVGALTAYGSGMIMVNMPPG